MGCKLGIEMAPADYVGMKIVCRSWKKTYQNLHDYNADQTLISVIPYMLTQDTRIFKMDKKYQFKPYKDRENMPGMERNCDGILDVVQNKQRKKQNQEGVSYFVSSKIFKTKQPAWVVAKSLPKKGYVLKQGDIIRIGKQKVRIKEIMSKTEQDNESDLVIKAKGLVYDELTPQRSDPIQFPQEQLDALQCRYCFDTADQGNPLIAPCHCAGTSKYVHLICLQKWLVKAINPRPYGKATAITWRPLTCQFCHKMLPFRVYLDGKSYFIVKMSDLKPARPYIILNPVYRSKSLGNNKIYMLISFAQQKQMILGRKSDTDVVISSDSTVGRTNSKIVFEPNKQGRGKFVLYDNDSKFGTLVLLRKPFHMVHELNGLSIQFGGDVLQLKVGNKAKSNGEVDVDDPINNQIDESESALNEVENNIVQDQEDQASTAVMR